MTIYTHKTVDGVDVSLTAAEIAELEARDAQWQAGAPMRQALEIERASGMKRWERDVAIATLPVTHPRRVTAQDAETKIHALGVRVVA